MAKPFVYTGKELQLFSYAVNWKKYFSEKIKKEISGDVLEVGAGAGENYQYLKNDSVHSWTSLEPDQTLFKQLQINLNNKAETFNSDLSSFIASKNYDTIIYIDVLEHIEGDKAEMMKASELLKPKGKIIILSPAYNFLMSEFDKEIGHFRRYNKQSLQKVFSSTRLQLTKTFYLESCGIFLLLMNKLLFRKKYPSLQTVKFWDRVIVPVSKITDKLFFYSFGKTIIGVWQKI